MPTEEGALLAAAQTAMRTTRREVANRQRRPNPAIDVAPDRAAYALAHWMNQDAGMPGAYREHEMLLVPQPGKPRLYCTDAGTLERPIDLSLEPAGSTVWTIANCTVQGRSCTMLMGAVRLENGDWSLFRQMAVQRGDAVVFETDPVWYNNRKKRSKKHAGQS